MRTPTPTPETPVEPAETWITRSPGVCGGNARIRNTRISEWLLENWRRLGMPETEILAEYPSLTTADLRTAWQYVADHPEEIEEAIRLNEAA
jgi:uncharacterized protein (DUF433 family)